MNKNIFNGINMIYCNKCISPVSHKYKDGKAYCSRCGKKNGLSLKEFSNLIK